jgi:hypothetical protein
MKKQILHALLGCLLMVPFTGIKAEGQSTEGRDFWVTFMQADQDPNNELVLSLSISSRKNCQVTITNPFTTYSETFDVKANEMFPVELYSGNVLTDNARSVMAETGKVCYAVNSEQVDTCALHVTATADISLFATNYKKATFDATNVLPTASLLDEYIIQTYTPSDHGGVDATQGSHFAIIAAEDGVVVDITPTVTTKEGKPARETFATETLNKGEVYYVWTGKKDGEPGDLSGTHVKARDGKKIAVFQGCPHTNIPYQVKQRDHLFSQAMPIQYWGNTFALTASADRVCDAIRVLAINDGTEVHIMSTQADGSIKDDLVHTFDFTQDTKQYWEFKLGKLGDFGKEGSCILTTSCPCAVHLFIVSQQYKNSSNKSGDPAMLWINPIEQQIDQVTFATYASSNSGTTMHHSNVVTDKPAKMLLDDNSIESQFKPVNGSDKYYYAQLDLGTIAASHTLKCEGGNFIAHVYGFTNNESYGYSAGGATRILTDITIEGQDYTPGMSLCGDSVINFSCKISEAVEKIIWNFGDGSPSLEGMQNEVEHNYANIGDYDAYVLIFRTDDQGCGVIKGKDSIPLHIHIERAEFDIISTEVPCVPDGMPRRCEVRFTNKGQIYLAGDNVTISFDKTAIEAGFDASTLEVNDELFIFDVPTTASTDSLYGLNLEIESQCGTKRDTLFFKLPFDNNVIDQRYDNVLGLLTAPFKGQTVEDFQWYRSSDDEALEGQVSATLSISDLPADQIPTDSFYVCFTMNKGKENELKTCACPKAFKTDAIKPHEFDPDATNLTITSTIAIQGNLVFVNADWQGKTDIECFAQWISVSGATGQKYDIPDGGRTIPTPTENGFYILRVVTDGSTRSFKIHINH